MNWVQGSTPSGLAATLAASINGLEGIPGSSCPTAAQIASATGYVSACASGGTVTLTSLSKGPAVDWSVTASAADTNPTYFSASGPNNYQGPPSFAVTTANMSGGEISGSVLYSYAISDADGYAPNGNLLSVADSVTGTWSYAYDNLNRVVTGTSTAGCYAGAQMSWSYDPFGNRQSESVGGTIQSTCGTTPPMPLSSAASYTTASNQVSSSSQNNGAGFLYDAAGNVLNDGQNRYLYDAESRLCAVQSVLVTGSSITQYVYDASGTRVGKGSLQSWPSSCNAPTTANGFTLTTSWVLGPGGEQVTEYSVSGGASTWVHTNAFSGGHLQATYHDTGTYFYLGDWLGTKRVEVGNMLATNGTPQLCATTYTSLAYGDGLTPVSLPGYAACPDATEQHFTGKERDAESGNDYFAARYYSSTMGRFMSPDWSAKVEPVPYAKVGDPQTLNLYAYVGNNPIVHVDMFGHDSCNGDFQCQAKQDWILQHQITNASEAEMKAANLNRLLIVVGDPGLGEHNQGGNFTRAAQTRSDSAWGEGIVPTMVRASSANQLANALTSDGTLGGVEYFGHASYDRLFVGQTSAPGTNLDSSNVRSLSSANMTANATFKINACYAGSGGSDSIAYKIAHQLGRTVTAWDGPTIFSTNPLTPDGRGQPPALGPLYLAPDVGTHRVDYYPE